MNYYFYFYLWIDYKISQQNLNKSTNHILLKYVSIRVVRDKFILNTKFNFEKKYSELDFFKERCYENIWNGHTSIIEITL